MIYINLIHSLHRMATRDQITVDNKHQMAEQLSQLDSGEGLHYIDSNLQYDQNLEDVFRRSAGISDRVTRDRECFSSAPLLEIAPSPFQKMSEQIIKSGN